MLEKIKGAIKNGQSRDTGSIGYQTWARGKDKQNKKHRTLNR